MPLPIFIDIDGTLTEVPTRMWGAPIPERIAVVENLIASAREVVLWSGGGTAYVRAFAEKHGLRPSVCIGKPGTIVDDHPAIRPRNRVLIVAPEVFFGR